VVLQVPLVMLIVVPWFVVPPTEHGPLELIVGLTPEFDRAVTD